MNMSALRDEFRSAVTRLVETTSPPNQASACKDALKNHMDTLGIEINVGYADMDFQQAFDHGHSLVEPCMDWWDELVSGIRYPVACCHVVTGTLPNGYVSHTAAAISVYDRDGKPIAHDAEEWMDSTQEETDDECHAKFARAIREAAARIGARSLFKFYEGTLDSSVSIAHHPEQGETYFHERTYGKHEEDTTAVAQVPEPDSSGDMIDDALTDIRIAYGIVHEVVRFSRELGREDWKAMHERLQSVLESLGDEPACVREEVDCGAFGAAILHTLEKLNTDKSNE
jgi:hypothetical protein